MNMKWLAWVVPGLLFGAAGCPSVETDTGEGVVGPTVEFDPANSIVPFPNNLALSADGTHVELPEQCNEGPATTATRVGILNKLDGFGTYELAMQVTFNEDVDPRTLNNGTIVLYKRATGLTGATAAPGDAIPLIIIPGMTLRTPHGAPTCGDPVMVSSATIVPRDPLDQTSFYSAAVLKGVKTMSGELYTASFTWSLVRLADNPVQLDASGTVTVNKTPLDPGKPEQLAQLQGIDLLWNAHAKALAFLETKGHARSDILVAWEFRTQTTTDPLDPAVTDSPASKVSTSPLTAVVSLTANLNRTTPPFVLCDAAGGGPGTDSNVQCFLKISLGAAAGASGAAIYPTGNALCAAAGCAAIGDVIGGVLTSKQYQAETPNAFDPSHPLPGQWSNPVHPTAVKDEAIQIFGFLPATPPPAGGYPFVVFGHGLGSSKKTLIAVAPSLAGSPAHYASIAIDFVSHDSRAQRISNDAAIGCADVNGTPPDFTKAPQCYHPFLSTDLGATRDDFRQSVLDVQGLVAGLKGCGLTGCAGTSGAYTSANFMVDTAHISYMGLSLGGILGGIDHGDGAGPQGVRAQRPRCGLARHPREHRDPADPLRARRRVDRRGRRHRQQVEPADVHDGRLHHRRVEGPAWLSPVLGVRPLDRRLVRPGELHHAARGEEAPDPGGRRRRGRAEHRDQPRGRAPRPVPRRRCVRRAEPDPAAGDDSDDLPVRQPDDEQVPQVHVGAAGHAGLRDGQ